MKRPMKSRLRTVPVEYPHPPRRCLRPVKTGAVGPRDTPAARTRFAVLATAVCLLLCVAAAQPAEAAMLTADTHVELRFPNSLRSFQDDADASTTHARARSLLIEEGHSADAQADTFFGLNSALALVTGQQNRLSSGFAISTWEDTFTITDPSGQIGAPLTATLGVQLDGLLLAPHPDSSAQVRYRLLARTAVQDFSQSIIQSSEVSSPTFLAINNELISVTFSFSNGEPFDVSGRLIVSASMGGANEVGVAKSDFSSTAIVTILDLPLGAILGTESGQIYPLQLQDPPTAVPEPSSLMLFGIGALALVGIARRRRRLVIE